MMIVFWKWSWPLKMLFFEQTKIKHFRSRLKWSKTLASPLTSISSPPVHWKRLLCLSALLRMRPQLYPTLEPIDCNRPLAASVHGISQARILEWIAISFSMGSSWSRDQTHVICTGRWILYPLSHQRSPQCIINNRLFALICSRVCISHEIS